MSDKIINEIGSYSGAIGPKLNEEFENSPEVADIRRIFGANANIEKNEDGWNVRVQLKDATCSGGQDVEVELVRKSKGDRHWYGAKDLIVDGTSLPEVFKNSFIFKVPTDKEKEEDKKIKIPDFLRKFLHTKATDTGRIDVYSLEDADGLATIFHEIGHTRDSRRVETIIMNEYVVMTYFNDESNSEITFDQAKKSAENVLLSEMTAHKHAIRAINYLRNKGNDVFKKDEGLLRLKKFLITTTMLRFNRSSRFIELVGPDRINQILKL
jgi:hypothetical protein